jgi:hypothetical protein
MMMSSSVSLVFSFGMFFIHLWRAQLDAGNTGSEAGEKSERLMKKKWEMYVAKI